MEEQKNQKITNLFVTYELALKLKEKGFDEPCLGYFVDQTHLLRWKDNFEKPNGSTLNNIPETWILAPLWQQIIDWLRKKHNMSIEIAYRNSFQDFFAVINPIHPKSKVRFIVKRSKGHNEALAQITEEALKLI